ncbi:DHHC zinc finger domain containing protein [Tritrichomonas foetus]|uniref:Palmitoyltransferase n=1 Tax=Tritrichomonas foetus TaxID=1144522 RepID=A0A1J4KTE5_9EUKA|nr:DHHC zinc finger domain containing protein [Tritrichomonas foetus]|eukprot:OHT14561.1 DHHC zinc finger domain containing protein [Tritrichomonas foetus]
MRRSFRILIALLPNLLIVFLAGCACASTFLIILPNLQQKISEDSFFLQAMIYLIYAICALTFALYLWCWVTAVVVDPGSVIEDLKRKGVYGQIQKGQIPHCLKHLKICPICNVPVPNGTVHCDSCECCMLRCDHHCPIIAQCVADRNMKSFCLSFFYASIFLLFSETCGIYYLFLCKDNLFNIKNIVLMIVILYEVIGTVSLISFIVSILCNMPESGVKILPRSIRFHKFLKSFGKNWYSRMLPIANNTTLLAWPGVSWYNDEEP